VLASYSIPPLDVFSHITLHTRIDKYGDDIGEVFTP
jgi:hypothetical protein